MMERDKTYRPTGREELEQLPPVADIVEAALPWAREHKPDAYRATVACARDGMKFRRYLARLLELRAEADPAWRKTAPLSVLNESALTMRMRHKGSGRIIEVKGRFAPPPQLWRFNELALSPEEFAVLAAWKETLDLYHIPPDEARYAT